MPDITITDTLKATIDIQLNNDARLAKSGLQSLNFAAIPLVAEFDKPVDQCTFKSGAFGLKMSSPGEIAIQSAATGSLCLIKPPQKALFDGDEFAPGIPINPGEGWVEFELDASVDVKSSASADGFGVALDGLNKTGLSTYTLWTAVSGKAPTLRQAIQTALENYSVTKDAASVRSQRVGTVNASDLSGTVTLSGSYSLPISVAPLASANLPFNRTLTIKPADALEIAGKVSLTGEWIVRSYKASDTEVQLGIYKKKGSTLSARFEASAGIQANTGNGDLLSGFFGAVLPGIDIKAAGLTGDDAENIQSAVKSCLDHSLSISFNAICSASRADESAVVYSVDLGSGDRDQTDLALASALRGDWTLLAALPNAKPLRNIVKQTHESSNQIPINLLGIYNAASVTDFVKTCTVLHDENGQISVLDKIDAKRIAAAGTPYGADANRLRSALAECFLATFAYTAGSGLVGALRQNYLRYRANMSSLDMRHNILLGRALNLLADSNWDNVLASQSVFDHARFSIVCQYDLEGIMRVFFADTATRLPYSRSVLESTGRKAKAALIDAAEPGGGARLTALNSDSIWREMNTLGNTAAFSTIAGLSAYRAPEIAAIAADWVDITWWADAMLKVAPKLTDVLAALQTSTNTDPSANDDLMKKRQALADVVGAVGRRSQSAFGDGWGLAVLFALSAGAPSVSIDYAWGGKAQHIQSAKQVQPVRAAST